MSNQLLTSQVITYETLSVLKNDLRIVKNFWRDGDKEFGKKGDKIGDTLYVRKPQRFIGRDGQAYQPEGLSDTQVPITINQQSGVDFEFSTAELYLSIDDFRNRYLAKAGESIANKLDLRCAQMAVINTANNVGTVGTIPGLSGSDAFYIYSQAGRLLTENGFQRNVKRTMALTAGAEVGWNTYSKAFFNPSGKLSDQWDSGQVSNALGYKWFVDENLPTQTIGALGGTPAVDGANQTGTTINLKGWTPSVTGVLNVGDVISYSGVYNVNPQSRLSTGQPFQQVVQAIASSDGAGLATVSVYPAMVPSGQYQNCTASPADSALVSVYGVAAAGQSAIAGVSTRQQLLWTPEAYAFMSFPGDVPKGVDMGYAANDNSSGVSLRFVRVWDAVRDQWINRFDVYYGASPMYPEGGVRVNS